MSPAVRPLSAQVPKQHGIVYATAPSNAKVRRQSASKLLAPDSRLQTLGWRAGCCACGDLSCNARNEQLASPRLRWRRSARARGGTLKRGDESILCEILGQT